MTLRARIDEVRRENAEVKAEREADLSAALAEVPGRGEVCPQCGIDLPTTWHWDGCPEERMCLSRVGWW